MSYERQNIQEMEGYSSGEQPLDADVIKLNTNENPYPPAPGVNEVISNFETSDLRRYPPPTADEFRSLAAKIHGLSKEQIIATRGGDELLRLLLTTFVDPLQPIGTTAPTYSLYPVLARIQNCPMVQVPLENDWSLPADFADQMNAAGVKLTLIVNPHAPTGKLFSRDRIRSLASELNSVLLVDEAYIDFVDPEQQHDCLSLVNEFDNIVFLRTLSKGYSLAGLRFGYGIGADSLIKPMIEKTRDSYNLDLLSQKIAVAGLADQTYAAHNWKQTRSERNKLTKALTDIGFSVTPSQTNFILVTPPTGTNVSAQQIQVALKKNGILVRYFNEPRLSDSLRISIGSAPENTKLLESLRSIVV
jgi:histidinol-phosphate aminotransferase